MSVSLLYIYLIYTIKLPVKNKLQATFYTNICEVHFYSFSGVAICAIWGYIKKCHPPGHFNCKETVESMVF